MIHILDRNIKSHWTYFAEVVDRVTKFCDTYDSDADSKILANIMIGHFAQSSDSMLILASVVNDEVVAHLLAAIDTWCGSKFATILQYEAEKGKMPLADKKEGYRILEAWAKTHQAGIQILARNPQVARLFSRYWGFKPERILMRKRVL